MNVSMQDGCNLALKLRHVLEGRSPEAVLATYSAERQVIAKNLIDVDKEWSALMATKPEDLADPSELEDFYVRTFGFPAGFMTQYQPSMLIESPLVAYTPKGAGIDVVFDVLLIAQQDYTGVDLGWVPGTFLPRTGPYGLIDYEKVYAADPKFDIFEAHGIGRDEAVVVVPPDQYVADVLPLTATKELADCFRLILRPDKNSVPTGFRAEPAW